MKQRPALRAYQERAVSYAIENPYCILALDPGLGKSRIAIEVRNKLKSNCLIVCPAYLIENWINELSLWSDPGYTVSVFKKGSDIYDLYDSDYAIISYDLAQKTEWLFKWADILILDESHLLCGQATKRTQYFHRVIYENSISRVIQLTGTPIKNRTEEFYSLLAICNYDPKIKQSKFLDTFPDSITFADYFSHRREYTIKARNRFIRIVKWEGIKRTNELKQWLEGHYLRIKSADELDLPPISYKEVLVSSIEDKELLEAFDIYVKESGGGVDPTAKAQAALKKVPITVQYAKSLLDEVECVVIYSDHVEASEEIARAFKTTALNGQVSAQRRMEIATEFQNGRGSVLVATIKAMSVGINLTRASHLILNDFCWTPGDLKQTVYRIQRLGQKNPCVVHEIVGSPQDKYIKDVIKAKLAVVEKAT
jgi:SNF2 family DNA or RNA helicase